MLWEGGKWDILKHNPLPFFYFLVHYEEVSWSLIPVGSSVLENLKQQNKQTNEQRENQNATPSKAFIRSTLSWCRHTLHGLPWAPRLSSDLVPHFGSVRAWAEETTDHSSSFHESERDESGSGILYGSWSNPSWEMLFSIRGDRPFISIRGMI